jgi:hypothetical protein
MVIYRRWGLAPRPENKHIDYNPIALVFQAIRSRIEGSRSKHGNGLSGEQLALH